MVYLFCKWFSLKGIWWIENCDCNVKLGKIFDIRLFSVNKWFSVIFNIYYEIKLFS